MELEEQIMEAIKTPLRIMAQTEIQTELIPIQEEQILIQMGLEEQIMVEIKTPMETILVVMEILMGIMAMVTTLMA